MPCMQRHSGIRSLAAAALVAAAVVPATASAKISELGADGGRRPRQLPGRRHGPESCQALTKATAYQAKVGPGSRALPGARRRAHRRLDARARRPDQEPDRLLREALRRQRAGGDRRARRRQEAQPHGRREGSADDARRATSARPSSSRSIETLPIKKGQYVALTVPTWAPVMQLEPGRRHVVALEPRSERLPRHHGAVRAARQPLERAVPLPVQGRPPDVQRDVHQQRDADDNGATEVACRCRARRLTGRRHICGGRLITPSSRVSSRRRSRLLRRCRRLRRRSSPSSGSLGDSARGSCPDACQALTRTTGYQAKVGPDRDLYQAPANGRIVAWTLALGKPGPKQTSFFEERYGGAAQAAIVVLDPGKKLQPQGRREVAVCASSPTTSARRSSSRSCSRCGSARGSTRR